MLTTTLRKLMEKEACQDRYWQLVESLPDDHRVDDPITIEKILKTTGFYYTLWVIRTPLDRFDIVVKFAEWCHKRASDCAVLSKRSKESEHNASIALSEVIKTESFGPAYGVAQSAKHAYACVNNIYCNQAYKRELKKQEAKLIELCEEAEG